MKMPYNRYNLVGEGCVEIFNYPMSLTRVIKENHQLYFPRCMFEVKIEDGNVSIEINGASFLKFTQLKKE